ncbi:cytochrome c oxidase subunit 3 [Acidocella aminolytica]|uniref:Cytochrome o ubiquinol oxidase subunit III n=1 Tax=Acidocella aminolytica 101 = DSM 11237 TaxID=1120923 RepID=A0A0D6PHQ0_9PROT|nr:cytochrome c oxidase subunit 3 [Acidocella aminolytica]GAN81177.1 cytochrome o ubiquinol oxidase subunit III [Acidocella aminolytica 101 = DSM 11237]GBQ35268.1 cytochrome o ubiquinol oxidase subunit III [Acidocella aminolytica 101 = DSM 11237]SHF58667.1 cytochrome o ubiquinol oxidase subunit 3 [Acidocella aminolytica 101 = DSM 11237]
MAHQAAPGANTRLFHPGYEGHSQISARTLGFWLYMLSDALLFTALFAAYAVLDTPMNAAGGPIASQIVNPVEGFWQTIIILASVTSYSLATVAMKNGNRSGTMLGIVVALVLGAAFVAFGFNDLASLAAQGNGMDRSGYLSAYFVLILTHALHMIFGALWMLVMLVQIPRYGFNEMVVARLLNLRMFWQFQATVWVCVYIYVYMIGA